MVLAGGELLVAISQELSSSLVVVFGAGRGDASPGCVIAVHPKSPKPSCVDLSTGFPLFTDAETPKAPVCKNMGSTTMAGEGLLVVLPREK